MALVGPYCHPVKIKSSPESSCSLTMLTMLGAMASATTRRTTERAPESSCSLTMLTMLGAMASATTRRTTERASRALWMVWYSARCSFRKPGSSDTYEHLRETETQQLEGQRRGPRGPHGGLIQRPLVIQEARIIGHLWAPSRDWDGMKR